MNFRHFKIIFFLLSGSLYFIIPANAQSTIDEKHAEVSLRMIGHQVMLSSNDSISRVLPIVNENGRYKIQFESDFEFEPDELVKTVNRVVKETRFADAYIVEVEHCQTKEIVYSFEVDDIKKAHVIPCKGRHQPKACYSLLFTITETIETEEVAGMDALIIKRPWYLEYLKLLLPILFLALISIFLRKKKNRSDPDPNLIPLGAYHFDKRNTELVYDSQKIELTNKEADLLHLLYKAVNSTVKREEILNLVWGDDGDYVGRTLDVFISKLRKKLEADNNVKIMNVRGVGYKLVLDT